MKRYNKSKDCSNCYYCDACRGKGKPCPNYDPVYSANLDYQYYETVLKENIEEYNSQIEESR